MMQHTRKFVTNYKNIRCIVWKLKFQLYIAGVNTPFWIKSRITKLSTTATYVNNKYVLCYTRSQPNTRNLTITLINSVDGTNFRTPHSSFEFSATWHKNAPFGLGIRMRSPLKDELHPNRTHLKFGDQYYILELTFYQR